MNTLHIGREKQYPRSKAFFKKLSAILFFISIVGGCTSATKKTSPETPSGEDISLRDKMGPPEVFGPDVPPDSVASKTGSQNGPAAFEKTKLIIVFGPGITKGFAAAGVLRSLQEMKVPIGAIYASEMSAFISVLYLTSESLNQFEWNLQKLKSEVFLEPGLLSKVFRKKPILKAHDGEKLQDYLEKQFGELDLSQLKIPVYVGVTDHEESEYKLIQRGKIKEILRGTLSTSQFLNPYEGKELGFSMRSSRLDRPFPVREAKSYQMPVLAVDFISDETADTSEASQADYILKVGQKEVDDFDLSKKPASIYRGKIETIKNQKIIKELLQEQSAENGTPQSSSQNN